MKCCASRRTIWSRSKNLPEINAHSVFDQLLSLTDFNAIVERYRKMPQTLMQAGADGSYGKQWEVIFLFHIMSISDLNLIHEEALRDINRNHGLADRKRKLPPRR